MTARMFDIGWGDFLVLVLAGLFILGPERLPGAASWLGKAVRQVKEYASNASNQMQNELGGDLGDLRKPLQELRNLRGMDPKRMLTKHLLDATGGYDPRDDLRFDQSAVTPAAATVDPTRAAPYDTDAT